METHNLTFGEQKIFANKPDLPSISSITPWSGGSDEDPAAELAHLRAENVLLRAVISTLSESGSGNPPSLPSARELNEYDCQWEDAAPSYQDAIAQGSRLPSSQ